MKKIDVSGILSNFRSGYNLSILNRLANKYEAVSGQMKILSQYLVMKKDEEKKDEEFIGLEKKILIQEGIFELSARNLKSVKKFIEGTYTVNEDALIRYCKMMGTYVEKINEKIMRLKKTIPYSNNCNTIQYNRMIEIIKVSSKNLFEEVNKASGIITKDQIIPKLD